MRILHIIATLNPATGGPVQGLRSIASAAKRSGIKSEIVCLDEPADGWLRSWEVPVHAVGPAKSRYGYTSRFDQWLAANAVRFDAFILEGLWMYLSLAARRAALRHMVPYYVLTHGTLHPWFRRYAFKYLKKVLYWHLFEHKVIRDATAVLFTSEEEKETSFNSFRPYRCNPIVVGYGIEPPPSYDMDKHSTIRGLTQSYPSLRNREYLLFLGRVAEMKGVDLLIEAFSRVKELFKEKALVIAGPSDQRLLERLRGQIAEAGLEDEIIWTGPVYDTAKWLWMRGAEAYALPSHHENFGVSVAEALACGVPVLISDKVNIWRQVHQAGAGLVENDDLEGTVKLLKRWQDLCHSERQAMGLRASSCFAQNFDIFRNGSRLFDVVRSHSPDIVAAQVLGSPINLNLEIGIEK